VEELLIERGLDIDHVTVWRWVRRYRKRHGTIFLGLGHLDVKISGS
jgi:transposase-like protein